MNDIFRKFSHRVAQIVGSPWSFLSALIIISFWIISGPIFNFSDTWQLVINTATTIITFLIVFLIQNTQNRDAKAIHLKLDELIRVVKEARTSFVAIEDFSDEKIVEIEASFKELAKQN